MGVLYAHNAGTEIFVPSVPIRDFGLNYAGLRVACMCHDESMEQVDGKLLAPKDPSIWAAYGKYWLEFKKVSMTLQGRGTIDGQGQTWWADSCKTVKTNVMFLSTDQVYGMCTGRSFIVPTHLRTEKMQQLLCRIFLGPLARVI